MSETRRWEDRAADLIGPAQAGHTGARDALLVACHPAVRRWAGVLTTDPDDAEDVAQEVLIQVASRIGSYTGRGGARFSTWLYRVTRNAALSWRRRVSRRLRLLGGHVMSESQHPPADPATRYEAAQLRELVSALFRELPIRQREVFYLVDIEGHEAAEIAPRLGLRPVTVRAHLFRARRALRSRILERHPEIAAEFRA